MKSKRFWTRELICKTPELGSGRPAADRLDRVEFIAWALSERALDHGRNNGDEE